jgi:hypothetical protein
MNVTDLVIGVVLGGVGAIFIGFIVTVFIYIIWVIVNNDYKYIVRIRNMTGGKAVIEMHKAKKINHPKLGESYYIPKLKTQKRHLLPYHGSSFELPITGKKWYVPFTYFNGEYTPEDFDPYSTEIEKTFIKETSKGVFEKVTEKVKFFILKPVNKAIRKWVLDADRVCNEENVMRLSWFERNKDFIIMMAVIIVVGVICFMAIIFAFQYASNVVTLQAQTPDWVQQLLTNSSLSANDAPPNLG